jgi:hypothetical protein
MPPYIGRGLVTECRPAARLPASPWPWSWHGSCSSLSLCLGAGCFIKCLCPLDRHIWDICPRLASDPFVERGLAWCGWWRPCVACVTLVFSLCRSCRAPATFNKASVRDFVVFAGLGLRWRRSQPAAGVAGSSVEAGLLGRVLWRSLGHQPAGCSALGLPI